MRALDGGISGLRAEGGASLFASQLFPAGDISGDDEPDTVLLRTGWEDAKQYICSFAWCGTILSSYFGAGASGIFAVFLFRFHPSRPELDPWSSVTSRRPIFPSPIAHQPPG
jgi:hypothetical protein